VRAALVVGPLGLPRVVVRDIGHGAALPGAGAGWITFSPPDEAAYRIPRWLSRIACAAVARVTKCGPVGITRPSPAKSP
jgi:hypothetical protein